MAMLLTPAISPKIAMACKMKTMREQLRKIEERQKSFGFTPCSSPSYELQSLDQRESTSMVNEAVTVGREKEKSFIISLLAASNGKYKTAILAIHGFGGIGKTTLAQLVFNDTQFKEYDHRVWVHVSQVFDLKKIGNSILAQVEGRQLNSREEINRRIHDRLRATKTLIILDDLWEENDSQLEELKLMLNVGSKMKVIVTTRKEDIAKKVCTVEPYELKPLDNDLCWDIIKKISQLESIAGKEQFEQIGRDIANKCGGVPLAAQAMGYMLRFKGINEWSEVRDNDIWSECSFEDKTSPHNIVLSSLKLSYEIMPPYLRLCFAYCAIFPKGHSITADDLIHQWIALDFIKSSNMLSATQLGEKCIRQLLGMSFLQHSTLPLTTQKQAVFTVHDLVHSLARSILNEELIVFDANKGSNTREKDYCRYALLKNYTELPKMSNILPDKIRALHFLKCGKLDSRGGEFSFAKCLRVLDLTECSITKFPSRIGQLKHLRYLIAPNMQNRRFPKSITQLSKLEYLSLHGSSQISALPTSIGKIERLMHIDLSGCSNLGRLPEALGSLTELQYLNLAGCPRIGELPQSIRNLTNLVHLDLSCCSDVKGIPEALGGLTKLKYLNLSSSLSCSETYDKCISSFSTHIHLEHLDLSKNECINYLPETLGKLKSLHTLDLSGCRRLRSLPESIRSIDSLEFLIVAECSHKLKEYIRQFWFKSNPVSLPHFVVRADDANSCSNLQQLENIYPLVLEISCLENVRSTEEAKRSKLSEKHTLTKLTFHWTSSVDRHLEDKDVLEELLPPRALEHIELHGYNSICFPTWFMDLPNLVEIRLEALPRCNNLPPLGQLPNLKQLYLKRLRNITKIDKDFCGGKASFCRLSNFTLDNMERLLEWDTKYSGENEVGAQFMFPMLDKLTIKHCPILRLKPCLPIFCEWSIQASDVVIFQHTRKSHAPSTLASRFRLTVKSSKLPLNEWRLLDQLPFLQELEINQCDNLTSLPESMKQLSCLQSLRLISCANISALPEWMADLKALKSLQIWGCRSIESLPELWCESASEEPIKFEQLQIWDCPELEQWCKSADNKEKLTWIDKRDIWSKTEGEKSQWQMYSEHMAMPMTPTSSDDDEDKASKRMRPRAQKGRSVAVEG